MSYFCRYITRQQQQIRTLIKNQNTMKRLLALSLMGLILTVVFAACGSKGHTRCDAYGNAPDAEQVDLAKE